MAEYIVKRPLRRAPVHPGEILKEDVLPALELSITEAAARLMVSRQHLHRILKGTHPITPEMALRVARLTNQEAAIWGRLQLKYDLWHAARRMKSDLARIKPAAA